MESLLPSEIARLVYGYLIEEKCEAAAQLFLETSSTLQECLVLKKRGRKFNTSVLGLSLVDILNLYTDAVCLVKNYLERKDTLNQALSDFVKELGNVLVLDDSGQNFTKTVFLRISVPNKRKDSRSEHGEENNEEEEEEEEEEMDKQSQKEQKKVPQNEQQKPESSEETTLPKNSSNVEDFDLNMLQALLDNTALHERLAENINKAMDSSGEITNQKTDEKKIVETILHNTEADPIFHELLNDLVAPRAEDTTTPEDTDKENGDPSEEKQSCSFETRSTTNEDAETSKKFEEESNLAIEGILAGNKMIQQEKVLDQPLPSEAVIISAPQVVGASNGIYKQSFIIPAGYTVTDVIPTTPVPLSSTLQPLKMANVASFGHLSPILPQQIISKPTPRSTLLPRRRKILPKSESFVIQIQNQDDNNIQEVQVEIPSSSMSPSPKKLPEIMKQSRVRTRGGLQKVGSRGVKAITPRVPKAVDDNIEIVFAPSNAKRVYSSGMKTRAMLKNQQNKTQASSVPSTIETVKEQLNVGNPIEIIQVDKECSKESETSKENVNSKENEVPIENEKPEEIEKPKENVILKENELSIENEKREQIEKPNENDNPKEREPLTVDEMQKEDCNKEENDGTPEQQNIISKPRISLSTPRRSHVRVLDFATPVKELVLRKSLTSPKVYHHKKQEAGALEGIKRGMFNSPPKETSKGDEKNNKSTKKKDWDADLRKYASSGEGMDIPTSVGLKRKNTSKKDKLNSGKKNGFRRRLTKKAFVKKKSTDELVEQIEKEVKDVIGEEEMVLNTSLSSEMGTLIEQKLAEEINKNDISFSSDTTHASDNAPIESCSLPCIPEEDETSPKEDLENSSKPVQNENSEPPENEFQYPVNDNDSKEAHCNIPEGLNTSTPLKITLSPINDNSRGQLTPTTKLVLSHLGKSSPRFPPVFSPSSQTSLENILIKECSRMETEKALSEVAQDIKKLDSPEINTDNCNINAPSGGSNTRKKDKSPVKDSKKELTFQSACSSNNVNFFQTPAKILTAPIPPGTPVEMTPLTRVLVSETSFATTMLVTPTLPPTPKNLSSSETPNKTDESTTDKDNISGNETQTFPNQSAIESKKTHQHVSNIEIHKGTHLESRKGINESHCTRNTNKDNEASSKSSDVKSSPVDKTVSKTPKIKLMSPRPTNVDETISEKKIEKSLELCRNNEEHIFKPVDEETSKVVTEHNFCEEIEGNQKIVAGSSEHTNLKISQRKSPKKSKNTKNQAKSGKKQLNTLISKKSLCNEENNKSSKKTLKQKTSKQVTNLMVDKEMELEIEHLLKDTKAKLFGPDNSSDSDSDSDSVSDISLSSASGMKVCNSQLKTARERLQKLDNIRMLNSSSTSDESSENEANVKHQVIEKDLSIKDETHLIKRASFDTEQSNVSLESFESNSLSKKTIDKKFDGTCNKQFVENPKTISKEIEESCESFPTLHLSEESNQSLKSDNHLIKYPKSKKSPLNTNDLLTKKNSALLLTAPITKPNFEQVVEIMDDVCISEEQCIKTNIVEKNQGQSSLHLDEPVFHIKQGSEATKTTKKDIVKSSNFSDKLEQPKSGNISKYLDDYVYSFTLNMDKSGNYLSKELRTSAFFDIFTFGNSLAGSANSYKEPLKTDHKSSDSSRNRNRKRHRSASSSDDEKEKRDYERKYSNYRRGRGRGYWSFRKNDSYDRKDSSRRKYSTRSYDHRYRDFSHSSTYEKRRSPDSKRSCKRDERRSLEDKCSSNKYDKRLYGYNKRYGSVNESFTSSKSGSDPGGKHTDINSTYSSDRTVESRKERASSSSQRLSIVEEQPFYSKPKPVPYKKRTSASSEKEDGELTDSSEVKRITSEENRSLVLALGAHDSRATLLKKVDLDHFLSIVHGNEK